MSVLMSGKLLNSTSVELAHGPSGFKIQTSAPLDNGGDGSRFSPTDLCAASLGACATTIMGMFAERIGVSAKIEFEIEKIMGQNPRKIAQLNLTYNIYSNCELEQFTKIENAGRTCPVRLSFGDGIVVNENYVFKKL